MITAESVLLKLLSDLKEDSKAEYLVENPEELEYFKQGIIDFAKSHVSEALKAAHEMAQREGLVTQAGLSYFTNAYSLENIK